MDVGTVLGFFLLVVLFGSIIVANAIQDVAKAIDRYADVLRKRQEP
jgi:hypothetical protein